MGTAHRHQPSPSASPSYDRQTSQCTLAPWGTADLCTNPTHGVDPPSEIESNRHPTDAFNSAQSPGAGVRSRPWTHLISNLHVSVRSPGHASRSVRVYVRLATRRVHHSRSKPLPLATRRLSHSRCKPLPMAFAAVRCVARGGRHSNTGALLGLALSGMCVYLRRHLEPVADLPILLNRSMLEG